MHQDTFFYSYSAKENSEIQQIRNKYLPQSESKLDELRRLDHTVQNAGMVQALSVGVIGTLIFGLGMCLAMEVMGMGLITRLLGVLIGLAGAAVMGIAHPVYRRIFRKTKEAYAPRILQLAEELAEETA